MNIESQENVNNFYEIPTKIRSGMTIKTHLFYLLISSLFGLMLIIPIDEDYPIILKIIFFLILLLILYIWVAIGILRLSYLEFTKEGIFFRTLVGFKNLKWSDISNIEVYKMNRNTFLGIISKEKLKNQKDTFLNLLSNLYGGQYAIAIPLNNFTSLDPEKFAGTYLFNLQELEKKNQQYQQNNQLDEGQESQPSEQQTPSYVQMDEIEDEPYEIAGTYPGGYARTPNPVVGLFKAFLISILVSVIYGITLYFFKINILIIPFIGLLAIQYTYFKSYTEKGVHLVVIINRIMLGIFSALQVVLAFLISFLILNWGLLEYYSVWDLISYFFTRLIESPVDYLKIYLYTIILFFFGVFSITTINKNTKLRK